MDRPARVLIVSKPVAPPYNDGSVCLVRDLAAALDDMSVTVLTTRDAPAVSSHVRHARIYQERGSFAPGLSANARVLRHLLLGPRYDIWHFVFAPNPLSSTAATTCRKVRKVRVLQTVASRPKSFASSSSLLFGDRVVALSRFTADRLTAHGFPASRIEIIPPPINDLERTSEQMARARAFAAVPPGAPMFVYAGDLEFSQGARVMADAVPSVLASEREAFFVFACRAKTERARQVQSRLQGQLARHADHVKFAGEVPDLPALLASATAAPFPVDDLYGKVDLPYAVLEACLLRVPVIVPSRSPLEEIDGAMVIQPEDPHALACACIDLCRDDSLRRAVGTRLRDRVLEVHAPARVAQSYRAIYADLVGRK